MVKPRPTREPYLAVWVVWRTYVRRKPTNWNENDTITACQLGHRTGSGSLLFQRKPKKFPEGIPSMRISSPLREEVRGPNGELLDGSTTVVSQ